MNAPAPHFDAVVVGSGFGGSVTAYRFQTGGKNVCLLERGKQYNPGDFPRSPSGLSRNVWNPDSGRYGMFQVWMFDHIEAVVSSALGGGSIIYANVLLEAPADTLEKWPLTGALDQHYVAVKAIIDPEPYPFTDSPYDETPKTRAFADAARNLPAATHQLPPLAVTFRSRPGAAPVPGEPIDGNPGRYTCRLCGECNVGCNFGSKNTLDFNYLRLFKDAGGTIEPLSEVTSFGQLDGGGFSVEYRRHDPKTGGFVTQRMTADRLVLAAGSLGTTYLLLKNAENLRPRPNSAVVGTRWCGNGDLLASLKKARNRDLDPECGPVITSALEYEGGRYYIEDGGYPAFIEWLTEGMNILSFARRGMHVAERMVESRMKGRRVSNISRAVSALIDDGRSSSRTLPLCGMGDDVPDGKLSLSNDGWLENDWSATSSKRYFETIENSMKDLARALDAEFSGDLLLKMNKLITAHPVGGCPMGKDRTKGVVSEYGQVFDVPGLSIADGSILPGPVGPNPSLTIAAIADRAATFTLANWGASAP